MFDYMLPVVHSHCTCVSIHPLPDQASGANAAAVGLMAESFAKKGWDFALKQDRSNPNKSTPKTTSTEGATTRSYSTSAVRHPPRRHHGNSSHGVHRCYSTSAPPGEVPLALLTRDVEGFPPRLKAQRERLLEFMAEEVYPAETLLADHQLSQGRWKPHPLMEELKVSLIPCIGLAVNSFITVATAWYLYMG